MGDNSNLFTLSESDIHAIKKPELVQKIISLKGKVIVDADISNLCSQTSKLNDTIPQLHSTNEKIRSKLAVVKNVNTKLGYQTSVLKKMKPSRSSTAGVKTLSYVVFRMIYQKTIWRKF